MFLNCILYISKAILKQQKVSHFLSPPVFPRVNPLLVVAVFVADGNAVDDGLSVVSSVLPSNKKYAISPTTLTQKKLLSTLVLKQKHFTTC